MQANCRVGFNVAGVFDVVPFRKGNGMTKRIDHEKHELWRKRLARYQASGLSIAQFCRNENLALHSFYYWDKRLRTKTNRGRRSGPLAIQAADRLGSKAKRFRSDRTEKNVPSDSVEQRSDSSPTEPMIQFTWGSKLRFSIPATCTETLQSILQMASQETEAPPTGTSVASRFRQVIVD